LLATTQTVLIAVPVRRTFGRVQPFRPVLPRVTPRSRAFALILPNETPLPPRNDRSSHTRRKRLHGL
jgi:hypothetical protein